MLSNLALFCLATVLATFWKIGRFFPNHLVTLHVSSKTLPFEWPICKWLFFKKTDEMTNGWNEQLMNWMVCKRMSSLHDILMKWQLTKWLVDEIPSRQSGWLMKLHINEMKSWWNEFLMKLLVNKMTSLQMY